MLMKRRLEAVLSKYACVTQGDVISVKSDDKSYLIDIVVIISADFPCNSIGNFVSNTRK